MLATNLSVLQLF